MCGEEDWWHAALSRVVKGFGRFDPCKSIGRHWHIVSREAERRTTIASTD